MFCAPPVHHERRTRADAGEPQPPTMTMYSNYIKSHREERHVPLAPIESIGIYHSNLQLVEPIAEINENKDGSLYATTKSFVTDVSLKPLSQFDAQVFDFKDCFGTYGADVSLALHK